jgi:hypothetical protein
VEESVGVNVDIGDNVIVAASVNGVLGVSGKSSLSAL